MDASRIKAARKKTSKKRISPEALTVTAEKLYEVLLKG